MFELRPTLLARRPSCVITFACAARRSAYSMAFFIRISI
jgi:hypothetical protein